MSTSHIKPLDALVDPGWARALADVEPNIHRMGDFLRGELEHGRRDHPDGEVAWLRSAGPRQ